MELKSTRGQVDTSAVLSQSTSQPEREKSAGNLEVDVLSSTFDCIQPCVNRQPCDQPMVGIIIGKEQQKAVSGTCSIKYPEVSACCDALLVVTKPVERLEVLPANVLGTRDRMPHFLFTAVWSSPGQSKETCTRTALELPEDTKHR
ncbi:hypothetical protein QQF64_035220 [Cirrhinus molitorella]|uniref:Uncharacterized protein n=1 Tax=Cirrhinus molitorella TaxID=172907 RepID=A0ABR3NF60_9TELE